MGEKMIDDEDDLDDSDSDIIFEKWEAEEKFISFLFLKYHLNWFRGEAAYCWRGLCMDGRLVSDAGGGSLLH